MKNIIWIMLTALLLGLLAGPVDAKSNRNQPGYIDLEWIEIPDDADEVQDIDLGPVLLSLVANAEEADNDDLADLLSMVTSLRVRAFSVDEGESRAVDQAVKRIQEDLDRDDWEPLIRMRDGEDVVTVSIKKVDEDIVGMMVVAFESGEEASFINIVGDLDLSKFMSLAFSLNDGELDDMLESIEDSVEVQRRHHRDR